jgi:hypothetical protein
MSDVSDIIEYPPDRNVAITGGRVVPVGPRHLSPSEIVSTLKDIVSMPYEGPDARKIGMSLLEAAFLTAAEQAADGDTDALEKILSRLIGKPVQQIVSASGTLKEFLDVIGRSEPAPASSPAAIDV